MDTSTKLTWIGGPTVIIEVGGVRLLTDPTFDPGGSSYSLGPVRMAKTAGPAVTPDQLGRIDAVLLSHDQHMDNLDVIGRAVLARAPLAITTVEAASRLGGTAVGLQPGQRRTVSGANGTVTVTAVRAEHGPGELSAALGPVIGFLVQPAAVRHALYVSGDTVSLDALPSVPISLGILHGGAARLPALGSMALSYTVTDLVEAARRLGDCPVVVVHHDGWDHFSEGPAAVAAAFDAAGIADRLVRVTPGQAVQLA